RLSAVGGRRSRPGRRPAPPDARRRRPRRDGASDRAEPGAPPALARHARRRAAGATAGRAGGALRPPRRALSPQGGTRARPRLPTADGGRQLMRRMWLAALILLLARAAGAQPCLNEPATLDDQRALAALRSATESACPCASFTRRGAYQRCARA